MLLPTIGHMSSITRTLCLLLFMRFLSTFWRQQQTLHSVTLFNSPAQKSGSKGQEKKIQPALLIRTDSNQKAWDITAASKRHESAGEDPTLPVTPGGRGT